MNTIFNTTLTFTAKNKNKHKSRHIPLSKKPIISCYNPKLYENPIQRGLEAFAKNLAIGIADVQNLLEQGKNKISLNINSQIQKWEKAVIKHKVQKLNTKLNTLQSQKNTITTNNLLNRINGSFYDVNLKITPMNFQNVTNDELFNFFNLYIQYYAQNGKNALIKASKEQALAEKERSKVIDEITQSLRKGPEHYTTKEMRTNLTTTLTPVNPKNNLENSAQYIDEIKAIYKIHSDNSEKINKLLESFRELSKNYFTETSGKLQNILDLKKDTPYKYLEKIPKVGILPRMFRVKEQYKMIKNMLLDYADASQCYIEKGTQPTMTEYFNQNKIISDYIKSTQTKFKDANNTQILQSMLEKLNNISEKKDAVYKNLLNIYANKGVKLTKACKQIKTKGKIELGTKLVSILTSLL